jgi:E3 ubiquitin-protein ligase BRE1
VPTRVLDTAVVYDADDCCIQVVQKDAIIRQLKEYRREKQQLEQRVAELEKSSTYHDDHLRFIDGWWKQLMDEVQLLVNETPPENHGTSTFHPPIPSKAMR